MRRKPVKIWQIILCALLVVLVIVLFQVFQKNDAISYDDGLFSQQAANSIQKNTGREDVRVLSFTYNNNEKENFVLKVAAQSEGERTLIYQVQYYEGDSGMSYRMNQTDDTLDTYSQAPTLSDYFSTLRVLQDNREAVFEQYKKQAEKGKDESFCQLDLRDCLHSDAILVHRVTETVSLDSSETEESTQSSTESGSSETSEKKETNTVTESRSVTAAELTGEDIDFWQMDASGVHKIDGSKAQVGNSSILLYRVSQVDDQMTEELLAVLVTGS